VFAGLDLDRDVHVTVRPVIAARHRTEHGKMANAAPTEFRLLRPNPVNHPIKCVRHRRAAG